MASYVSLCPSSAPISHSICADAMAVEDTDQKKLKPEHVEQVHIDHAENEKYKAMRIDGDEEDHMHEPPVCILVSAITAGLTSSR